jgi:Ca2+/H+ antiporter, TMEM165/GDT1 family
MPVSPVLAAAPVVFGVIFLAELPDKTSLTSLTLATRQPPLWVWLGAAGAFLAQTAISVAAGTAVAAVPHVIVRVVSGLCFLAFAVLMWRRREHESAAAKDIAEREAAAGGASFAKVVGEAAVLVFLAEFGDLTQFAIAAMEARLAEPLLVGVSAWLGLVAAAFVAVVVGSRIGALVDPVRLQKIAAVVFAALGVSVLMGFSPGGI